VSWRDITSYSRNDETRTPRTWKLVSKTMDITVTRHIHYLANEWALICDPWFNKTVISTGTADEAKQKAIALVIDKLEGALSELKSL
jgi:hypothetical protein